MVALARLPGPSTYMPLFSPISFAMGPLTMKAGHGLDVLAMWFRWNSGSVTASTAATTTGMYSGLQPAMTALIATFSAVTARFRTW